MDSKKLLQSILLILLFVTDIRCNSDWCQLVTKDGKQFHVFQRIVDMKRVEYWITDREREWKFDMKRINNTNELVFNLDKNSVRNTDPNVMNRFGGVYGLRDLRKSKGFANCDVFAGTTANNRNLFVRLEHIRQRNIH